MILKNNKGIRMFQKLAPLIILALFAAGAYFMVQGMHNAMDLADHKKVKAKQGKTNK